MLSTFVPQAGAGTPLHIESVRSRFVKVPMRFPLGTSAATVTEAPLLLVDLQTKEGVVGRSYLFCYRDSGARAIAEVLREAIALVAGRAVEPVRIGEYLARRYALLGVTGVARMALAALDIALWDALAVAAAMPMATFLGGSLDPIATYNSDGLGLMPAEAAADEAVRLMDPGFSAVKLRLGHMDPANDLEVARAVRAAVGPSTKVMVDYNQALTVAESAQRARALEEIEPYWLEEQIRHGDLRGYASLARDLPTPIQIGENLDGPEAVLEAVSLRASDYLMLDAARIGGVTGWMRGAAIAAAAGVPVSSHLFPEISVHLLAATPGAHWLEYVSWADVVVQEPLVVKDGFIAPSSRPGLGLAWSEEGVQRFQAR